MLQHSFDKKAELDLRSTNGFVHFFRFVFERWRGDLDWRTILDSLKLGLKNACHSLPGDPTSTLNQNQSILFDI